MLLIINVNWKFFRFKLNDSFTQFWNLVFDIAKNFVNFEIFWGSVKLVWDSALVDGLGPRVSVNKT